MHIPEFPSRKHSYNVLRMFLKQKNWEERLDIIRTSEEWYNKQQEGNT